MLKIENIVLPSAEQWEAIIRGMRNPKNSWERMDSYCRYDCYNDAAKCPKGGYIIGPNDKQLMTSLANGGSVHAKYRRKINVYLDITAPLYWWKEFDTYKIGTSTDSCSTMHKIHAKEFTLEDFSCEHLMELRDIWDMGLIDALEAETFFAENPGANLAVDDISGALAFRVKDSIEHQIINYYSPKQVLELFVISALNANREAYLKTKDKKYWWQMIQLLPTSYNQRRSVMLNYEVLVNIYKWRKNHKLDEWHTFCDWIESLPYSELITGCNEEETEE